MVLITYVSPVWKAGFQSRRSMFQVFECWGFAVSKPPTGNGKVLESALNDCLFNLAAVADSSVSM